MFLTFLLCSVTICGKIAAVIKMINENAVYAEFAEEKADIGESKFFGAPDLPEDFDWPVDEDEFDMDFICQINCADAGKYNSLLPEKGMLYFFGCIANPLGCTDAPEITAGFQSMGNFCVKYTPNEAAELQSGEIVDENGDPAGFNELKITFSENENVCTEAHHQILGTPPEMYDEIKDYVMLFCLDSFSGDDFTLEFEDSGYLYYLIKKDDLAKMDFSNVICYLAV